MNRLYPSAKHAEIVTRRLIRLFAENRPIKTVARRTRLTERQVINIFDRIRTRIGDRFADLTHKRQQTEAWKEAIAEHIRWTAKLAVARYSVGLNDQSSTDIGYETTVDPKRAAALMKDISENKEEFQRYLAEASQYDLKQLKDRYVQTMIKLRRGVRRTDKEVFEKEYTYRFSVFMCCRHDKLLEVDQKTRKFSDGKAILSLDKSLYERLFANTPDQADIIEEELLNIIREFPL